MSDFTVRPATMVDLGATVDFCNIWEEAHAGTRSFTHERIRNNWEEPGFDLANSTRMVLTPDNEIIGLGLVWDVGNPPVKPHVMVMIHPDRSDEGLAPMLFDWAEVRCQECLSRVPSDVRVVMRAGALSTFVRQKERMEQAGFQLVRHFYDMRINLDEAPPLPAWPEGIKIHHYNTQEEVIAALPKIMTAVNDAFRDHYGYVERPLVEDVERWTHSLQNDSDFDPTLWFTARDGDEIAGMSLCWLRSWNDPDEGYVGILGVRRPWRRQGLALALLHHSFTEFYKIGKPKAGLSVDASSLTGAVDLYKKAGMHVHKQYDNYEKEIRSGREISTQSLS